jgi:hypothetical protein
MALKRFREGISIQTDGASAKASRLVPHHEADAEIPLDNIRPKSRIQPVGDPGMCGRSRHGNPEIATA